MIRFCVGLFTALISGIAIFEACTKNLEPAPPTHEIAISIVFLCLVFVAGIMLMFPWFQKTKEKKEEQASSASTDTPVINYTTMDGKTRCAQSSEIVEGNGGCRK